MQSQMHAADPERTGCVPIRHKFCPDTAVRNRGLTMVLQLKQHLLELRQTQESLQEQTQLCNAQEEEIVAIQAEYVHELV